VLIGTIAVGCGGKPAAKAPEPARSEPTLQVVEEAPDLSPVAKPKDLVLSARVTRPRLLVETIAGWASLPGRLEEALPKEARGLSQAVLWEAPVDALVALDAFGQGKVPPPLAVVSVGLKSLSEALGQAEAAHLPTRRLAPGIHRVGDWADVSCVVAASVGTAPARLVCGHSQKDVDALLPYATRGLPSEPQTGADFELTLDAGPLQERYGRDIAAARLFAGMALREVALDSPRFDRALSDAIYGGVDEVIYLFSDLDRLRVEARLDAARNLLMVSGELRLKGQSSWTSGTIAAMTPADLPASLPRLPPGATSATYSVALPAERYVAAQRILGDLLEGFLEHEKLPEPTRKRARRFVEGLLAKMPEAFGFSMSPPRPANDPEAYSQPDTNVTRFSEPAARLTAALNDLGALIADPAVKRWIKQRTKIEDKAWPKFAKKPFKLAGFKSPATAYEIAIDLEAWAKVDKAWAQALKNALPAASAKGPTRYALVVQPEGNLTYLASGKDTQEIARVMLEHRKSEPGAVFARTSRQGKVIAAGFLTLALVARRLETLAKVPELGTALAAAPQHGETPIPFSSTTGPGSARFDIELPAAAFADVAVTAVRAGPALKDSFNERRP